MTKNQMRLIHPGKILREKYLEPTYVSQRPTSCRIEPTDDARTSIQMTKQHLANRQ